MTRDARVEDRRGAGPMQYGGLVGFELAGGRGYGRALYQCAEGAHVANIGDSRSFAINPASTTHSQLTPEEQPKTNDFEKMLADNHTRILKFYLHISPDEQLARFKQRLDDPGRNWKISESDYSERELWPKYVEAYEDAIAFTRTKHAPWYVIPSNRKWFRNLAVSQIIADTMEEMGLKLPPSRVDIADIRRKYHAAKRETRGKTSKASR
jgi:hypothetical protein